VEVFVGVVDRSDPIEESSHLSGLDWVDPKVTQFAYVYLDGYISVGVFDRACYQFYVKILVKGPESSVDELLIVISYDGVGNSKPTYNASAHKTLDILGQDGGEGLDIDPFGEIIHPDQGKFCLFFAQAEGIDDVHSLNGE